MCRADRRRILDDVSGEQTFSMADVEDTAQDFWASRPRRPRKGRKIAGVAAGIANRYRIDPTLVRVALVVATIYGGAGLVVYLLGWLCLPEEDDAVSPIEGLFNRGRSSTSSAFTIVLCLAFIPVLSWFFSGFPGFLGLLVVVGLLMLLHRRRGSLSPRPSQPAAAPQSSAQPDPFATPQSPFATPQPPFAAPEATFAPPPVAATVATPQSGAFTAPVPPPEAPPATEPADAEPRADFPDIPTSPPAWDPLGAAPFAWDLPDPAPPQPEPEPPAVKRSRSKIGLMTVGVTLITVATLSMLGMPETDLVGVALGVLGLGMVVGSFVRGGRGLIGLAVPLAVVGIGLTSVSPQGWNGVGDIDEAPTSARQVRPMYDRTAGSVNLDLSGLRDTTDTVSTHVRVGAGSAQVILPADADVEVTCQAEVGDVRCLDREVTGFGNDSVTVTSEGAGELQIYLTIEVTGAGDVEVTRG